MSDEICFLFYQLHYNNTGFSPLAPLLTKYYDEICYRKLIFITCGLKFLKDFLQALFKVNQTMYFLWIKIVVSYFQFFGFGWLLLCSGMALRLNSFQTFAFLPEPFKGRRHAIRDFSLQKYITEQMCTMCFLLSDKRPDWFTSCTSYRSHISSKSIFR